MKNRLEGLTKLQHSVTIYIPSTDGAKGTASAFKVSETVAYIAEEMAKLFGGYTITEGTGGYYSEELGETIEEKVYMIRSNTDNLSQLNINKCVIHAEYVKDWHAQECVSLEIDGTLYFV